MTGRAADDILDVDARCDTVGASCVCTRRSGHPAPHACPCGGAWVYDDDGEEVPVRVPYGIADGVAVIPLWIAANLDVTLPGWRRPARYRPARP